jgi:predicted CoA-binding protein
MQKKITLVLGASPNPERMSFQAVQRLRSQGYPVRALGVKDGKIGDVTIETSPPVLEEIHTVTLYLNPALQPQYYEYILNLRPTRIIFNPGTENPALEKLAIAAGIRTERACTLVLLSTGQFMNK